MDEKAVQPTMSSDAQRLCPPFASTRLASVSGIEDTAVRQTGAHQDDAAPMRAMPSLEPSVVAVGLVAEDGECPVDLLDEHEAGEAVREGHGAEGEAAVGRAADV